MQVIQISQFALVALHFWAGIPTLPDFLKFLIFLVDMALLISWVRSREETRKADEGGRDVGGENKKGGRNSKRLAGIKGIYCTENWKNFSKNIFSNFFQEVPKLRFGINKLLVLAFLSWAYDTSFFLTFFVIELFWSACPGSSLVTVLMLMSTNNPLLTRYLWIFCCFPEKLQFFGVFVAFLASGERLGNKDLAWEHDLGLSLFFFGPDNL
jgi:hypothetical protein